MDFYVIVLVTTLLAAVAVTPVVRGLALRWQILDRPGVRKVHDAPVPYLGGLALLLVFVGGVGGMAIFDAYTRRNFRVGMHATQLLILLGPALLVFSIGLIDDIRAVRPRTKLLVQVLAATILCAAGVRIESLRISQTFFIYELGPYSWPVTILWIVGVTNAINLIDGLDGLAAGIALIAAAALAIVGFYFGQRLFTSLALCLVGGLAGFLFFNFNPAKIFLGDSGSLLLGYLISALAVMEMSLIPATIPNFAALAVPALALGIPIFDSAYSIVRRILERRSPFAADKGHIHHRLLALGWSPVRVVVVLYAVSLLVGGLALVMLATRGARDLIVLASCLLLLALFFRFVGHVQLRPTLAALKQKQDFDREQKLAQRTFETLQLQMQETTSFDGWWDLLCRSAQQMGFTRLRLHIDKRDGSQQTLEWQTELSERERQRMVTVDLPVRQRRPDQPLHLHLEFPVRDSLETAGNRLALFARLLDERSVAELPDAG